MNIWIRSISIVVLGLSLATTSLAVTKFTIPPSGDDIVGQNYTITVKKGDSLTTIRQKHEVSYDELLEANPKINFYRIRVGQIVVIPKQYILPKFRRGIVINIPELRLYYFTPDGQNVYTFPVGLGREDWRTPLINAIVTGKEPNPAWHVPNSIRQYVLAKTGENLPEVVPPGPKNPLGKYALHLSVDGYLIHGTNAPTSVGTFISSGCMRLMRDSIEELYNDVQVGTPVHVIHYPNKAGWRDGKLYLESHPPINSYLRQSTSELNNSSAQAAISEAVHMRPANVDWDAVADNVDQHLGIPKPIGTESA